MVLIRKLRKLDRFALLAPISSQKTNAAGEIQKSERRRNFWTSI